MLFLVRHGQTAANAAGLIQGRTDPDLTALGRRQAADLAEVLPRASAATWVSSPLRRARQTAEAFATSVTVDDRWIEMDYGELEGAVVADVRRALWEHWSADPDWRPPGGESLSSVAARVAAACEELTAGSGGRDLVVVTHVTPIKMAVAWALGVGPQVAGRMFVDLASVTTIGPGPVLRGFSALPGPGTGGRAG